MRFPYRFAIVFFVVILAAPSPGLDVDAMQSPGEPLLVTLEQEAPAGWQAGDPLPGVPMPEAESRIGPGTLIGIETPENSTWCTGNFIWEDEVGERYLGVAGHCVMDSGFRATHGPDADYDASDVRVSALLSACPAFTSCHTASEDREWVELGPVAYARQGIIGNDFGLVHLPEALDGHIRYEMPVWGGPEAPGGLQEGEPVGHYGYGVTFNLAVETRGRLGEGLGVPVPEMTISDPFAFAGTVSGGDSGSAAVSLRPVGADAVMRGEKAIGVITHATPYVGVVFGTQVQVAQEIVARDLCLNIRALPGGEIPNLVAEDCGELPEVPTIELFEQDNLRIETARAEVREVRIMAAEPFQLTSFGAGSPAGFAAVGDTFVAIHPEGAFEDAAAVCGAVPEDWTWLLWGHGSAPPNQNPVHPPGPYTLLLASEVPTTFRLGFNTEFNPLDLLFPDEPRVVEAGVSDKTVGFPRPIGLERAGPEPATLAFQKQVQTTGPSILATSFMARPPIAAGSYETGQSIAQDGTGPCRENTHAGIGEFGPTGSSSFHLRGEDGGFRVGLSGLLPGPSQYDWSGFFRITAGHWNGDDSDATFRGVLITSPPGQDSS